MKNPGLPGFVIEIFQSREQAALKTDPPKPQPVLIEVQLRPNLEQKCAVPESEQEKGTNARFISCREISC